MEIIRLNSTGSLVGTRSPLRSLPLRVSADSHRISVLRPATASARPPSPLAGCRGLKRSACRALQDYGKSLTHRFECLENDALRIAHNVHGHLSELVYRGNVGKVQHGVGSNLQCTKVAEQMHGKLAQAISY